MKSAEASRFRNTVAEAMPPNADSPMLSCGMRWPVASSVAPTSGVVEIVTSVVRFQVELIPAGRSMAKVKARLTIDVWRDSAYFRICLGREDEGDTTEVVVQADDRVDVVKSEFCVDLA